MTQSNRGERIKKQQISLLYFPVKLHGNFEHILIDSLEMFAKKERNTEYRHVPVLWLGVNKLDYSVVLSKDTKVYTHLAVTRH